MPNNKKKKSAKKAAGKKKAAHTPSQAAVTCVQCARPVKPSNAIECICTTVIFCSHECREVARSSSHASCPGPPDDVIDLTKKLQEIRRDSESSFQSDPRLKQAWQEEHRRTIAEPMRAVLLQHRVSLHTSGQDGDLSTEEYAKFADQGHASLAYLAGVRYKNRIIGKMKMEQRRGGAGHGGGGLVAENSSHETPGILSTDQLAVKYLLQAAEAGIGLAMQSLGDCYENGQGVRKSMRECRDWYWYSALIQSAGALKSLDTKTIVPKEFIAQKQMLQQGEHHVSPGESIGIAGPNLGSLMIVLHKELKAKNYAVPAFAAPLPTFTAGNPPRTTHSRTTNTAPVKLIGANELEEVACLIDLYESRGIGIVATYGRRGIAKEATVQTYGATERCIDNLLLCVPPTPACDERLDTNQVSRWIAQAKTARSFLANTPFKSSRELEVQCVHGNDNKALLVCQQCIDDAYERLEAISTGSAVLSIEEPLQSRGQVAIWRRTATSNNKATGRFKSETFKDYGRGEAECALAALVACASSFDVDVAHPLFVAQDPNFFWPLIYSHGSIRAALEYVAPQVDWNSRLGRIRVMPEAVIPNILEMSVRDDDDGEDDRHEIVPGDLLRKCGNDLCLNLEPNRSKGSFRICSKCERRSYCSPECQKADWTFHRRECQAASSGRVPTQQDPLLASNSRQRARPRLTPPALDEEVVVYGLVSKPEYNGRLGTITGDLTSSERYPVKLPNHPSTLAVKPTNFHRLGVYISAKREKKTKKYRCAEHGKEVCISCCLDFGIVNHLYNLHVTNAASALSNREAIEQISERHFATITREDEESECSFDNDFPMECAGLANRDKRVVLKALLESPEPRSLRATAAIAGLVCFGARSGIVTRPHAVRYLQALVDMW